MINVRLIASCKLEMESTEEGSTLGDGADGGGGFDSGGNSDSGGDSSGGSAGGPDGGFSTSAVEEAVSGTNSCSLNDRSSGLSGVALFGDGNQGFPASCGARPLSAADQALGDIAAALGNSPFQSEVDLSDPFKGGYFGPDSYTFRSFTSDFDKAFGSNMTLGEFAFDKMTSAAALAAGGLAGALVGVLLLPEETPLVLGMPLINVTGVNRIFSSAALGVGISSISSTLSEFRDLGSTLSERADAFGRMGKGIAANVRDGGPSLFDSPNPQSGPTPDFSEAKQLILK